MLIEINTTALTVEANRLDSLADQLDGMLRRTNEIVNRKGLPPYTRQALDATADIKRNIQTMRVGAGLLRSRCALAYAANGPGGRMLSTRLRALEVDYPDEFMDTVVDAGKAWLMTVGLEKHGKAIKLNAAERHRIEVAAEAERRIKARLRLPPGAAEIALARMRRMAQSARIRVNGRTIVVDRLDALHDKVLLKQLDAIRHPPHASTAEKTLAKFKPGFVGPVIDASGQILADADEDMGAGRRAGRVVVAVGSGAAAGAAATGVCIVTLGTGCVFFALGGNVGGNFLGGRLNRKFLPSPSEKQEQALREQMKSFRRAEQWYIDNAKPSPQWLAERQKALKVNSFIVRPSSPRAMGGVHVTTYTHPEDGHVVFKEERANGKVIRTEYDEDGKVVKKTETAAAGR